VLDALAREEEVDLGELGDALDVVDAVDEATQLRSGRRQRQ